MAATDVSALREECADSAEALKREIAEREARLAELTRNADDARRALGDFVALSDEAIAKVDELAETVEDALQSVTRRAARLRSSGSGGGSK